MWASKIDQIKRSKQDDYTDLENAIADKILNAEKNTQEIRDHRIKDIRLRQEKESLKTQDA